MISFIVPIYHLKSPKRVNKMTLFDFGSLYCDGIDLRRSPHTHNDKIESNVEVFNPIFQ